MIPSRLLRQKEARSRFAEAVATDETRLDLARAALLIAAEEEPGLLLEPYLECLEEWGREARELVNEAFDGVTALNDYLFARLGFKGNREKYQDARNSYLNRVIERRVGLPITLSVVYLEVAWRAGLRAEGVGMPGHFIVRVSDATGDGPYLVDPFHQCLLSEEDCQDKLDEIFNGRLVLHPLHLRGVTKKEILARMLANLKGVYAQNKQFARAVAAGERILLVNPEAFGEWRDGALMLAEMLRWDEAVNAAEKYLKAAPAAPDFTETRELLKQWQRRRAALN
jgi:regulator of sirC expression with transglutaminase-like and TPR domain